MPTSSFTKNFVLDSAEAIRRFEEYEREPGVVLSTPAVDPLQRGREILARRYPQNTDKPRE